MKPPPKLINTLCVLCAVGFVVAPWFRNRQYLRDLFDYGLMIVAAGRINSGQSAYVDFTTTTQLGSFLANAWSERIFGPTYQSLTLGNLIFTVAALLLLIFLFRRVFSMPLSALFAAGIVIGSAGQHTIIWYNSIGVVALAAACLASALAPVWKRADWQLNWIVGVCLLLGGINKLNFHAIALAVVIGWALRAGVLGRESIRRVTVTIIVVLFAGIILPVAVELMVTGATLTQWFHNVVILPLSVRSEYFSHILSWNFYTRPMHDYYGPVLQPVGAIFVIWTLLIWTVSLKDRAARDRWIMFGASIILIGGIAGLLATNHEIVYVSLAAGIALILAFWVGFEVAPCTKLKAGLLFAPCVVFTIWMFSSAWQGQRSLFGHEEASREAYTEFDSAEPRFTYFQNTRLPPSFVESFRRLEGLMPPLNANDKFPIFFGTGVESLERIWPTPQISGMPLAFVALNTTSAQISALERAYDHPAEFSHFVRVTAWSGHQPSGLEFLETFNAEELEAGILSVRRLDNVPKLGPMVANDSIGASNLYGGNMDPQLIEMTEWMWPFRSDDHTPFIGTRQRRGSFIFKKPTRRVTGTYLVKRKFNTPLDQELAVQFNISNGSVSEYSDGAIFLQDTLVLPSGQRSVSRDFDLDTRGENSRFVVSVPPESDNLVEAGFTIPTITHSGTPQVFAPILRTSQLPETTNEATLAERIFPEDWKSQFNIVARGTSADASNGVLSSGSEIWLRADQPLRELKGRLTVTHRDHPHLTPTVRIVWYKSGRIQILHQVDFISPQDTMDFKAWPAEDGGWYGILADAWGHSTRVDLEITEITPRL